MRARGREPGREKYFNSARVRPSFSSSDVLYPLPRWFVHAVLLLVPVDTRLRCSGVDRAWRALLADTTLFSRVDLSASSGVTRFSLPLFRAAVAKAGWRLRALDVCRGGCALVAFFPMLCDTLVANAATLRVLALDWIFDGTELMRLLEAAPNLEHLEVKLNALTTPDTEHCRRYLRNEPPFGPLRLRGLSFDAKDLISLARFNTFLADLHKQPLLSDLQVDNAPFFDAAIMRVFVDAALVLNSKPSFLSRPAADPGRTIFGNERSARQDLHGASCEKTCPGGFDRSACVGRGPRAPFARHHVLLGSRNTAERRRVLPTASHSTEHVQKLVEGGRSSREARTTRREMCSPSDKNTAASAAHRRAACPAEQIHAALPPAASKG